MTGYRKAVVLFVAIVLAPMVCAAGLEAQSGRPAAQGGTAGYAAEAQRQREQRQMQDQRDAHRERAESREKALQDNIRKYEARFGAIVVPVKKLQQPQQPRPSAQDLYDTLKLTDEVMSGTYANAVMIGHSAYEFSFDFITTFFPRSAVACRVFLSAPNAPR